MRIGTSPPMRTIHSHDLHLSDPVVVDDRVLCLHLTGVLDGLNATEFVAAFTSALGEAGPAVQQVDIEMAGLSFLDSAGVRALLRCRKAAEQAGRPLCLTDPAPAVLQVLTVTGLRSHFGIEA